MKIKIYTLGCKVNQYDSSSLEKKFLQANFKLVKEKADMAIINTCAVTKKAIRKCRQTITKAKKENPKAKIILTGCWPKVYKNDLESIKVDAILAKKDIIKLFLGRTSKDPEDQPKKIRTRTRYTIKIQDGCEQFCSYCIIPYARGKLKSRSEREVVAEIKKAVKAGHLEVVLCGIHLGLYGYGKKYNLISLLKKLVKIEGLKRIRLSSIEVTEVSDVLIKLITKEDKICQHIHIPLQSGSNKILKLMNRPYNLTYFEKKVRAIRRAMPDCAITTDVIVGFPGEDKADFKKICAFIKKQKFSHLHVFPFSAHEKAPASKFKGQLDKKTKQKRALTLRKIGDKLEKKYINKFKGQELEIIVEKTKNGLAQGKTEFYFDREISLNCS